MSTQRVAQTSCGDEDADDCDTFRDDPLSKLTAGRLPEEDPPASTDNEPFGESDYRQRTASNELRIDDQFIASFDQPPQAIVVDLDPSADPVHGSQQMVLFNAFEDEYCFMPFHLYAGLTGKLITTVLCPGKSPTGRESSACSSEGSKSCAKPFRTPPDLAERLSSHQIACHGLAGDA